MRPSLHFLLGLTGAAALSACAQGSQLKGRGTGDGGAGGAGGYGGDVTADVGGFGGYGGDVTAGGYGGQAGGMGGAGGAGGLGGSGGAGGMGGGGGGGMGGGSGGMGGSSACEFASPNTCTGAEQLPAVSGDEGGVASAIGQSSKWLKIRVKETDSSIFASDLSYKVALTSPAGVDYDLFVRQGPEDGNPDCTAAELKGAPSGGAEVVTKSWNDDQGIGGEDDSRWLSIEVRHISGDDCSKSWSLIITGKP